MEYIYDKDRIHAEDSTGKLLCEVTFPAEDETTVKVNHVFVDPSLRGGGVASTLMKNAYDYFKEKNLRAIARCPYAISWFKRHEQYQDIVVNIEAIRNA